MKRKVWLLLPAVPVLYLLILGTHVAFTFSHAKSYISSLKGQYSQTELQNKSKNLATDINHVLSDLNIPGVKQIVQAFGFNFGGFGGNPFGHGYDMNDGNVMDFLKRNKNNTFHIINE